jgi:hypothetical protein
MRRRAGLENRNLIVRVPAPAGAVPRADAPARLHAERPAASDDAFCELCAAEVRGACHRASRASLEDRHVPVASGLDPGTHETAPGGGHATLRRPPGREERDDVAEARHLPG